MSIWFKGILAVAVLGAAAVGAATWVMGSRALHPSHRPVAPPPADLNAERIVLRADGAPDLVGWRIPQRGELCGVVVLLHGRGDARDGMLDRAALFAELGFASLAFDFRGHGESGGAVTGFGYDEADDVVRIVEAAREFRPSGPLAIVGVSMGAAAAAQAAHRIDARAYVLELLYSTLHDTTARRMPLPILRDLQAALALSQTSWRLGFAPSDLRPIDRIAEIETPMLLLAGGADALATPEQSRALAAAAGPHGRLIWFDDAAHVDLHAHDPSRYADEVAAFLRARLCGADAPSP